MVLLDRMAFVLFVLLKTEDNMAQTPPLTTYYVIQPTLGCNGMWAFGPASEMWGCAPPYTYDYQPNGCAPWVNWSVSGDTVYMPLCSFPCEFHQWYSVGLDEYDTCAWASTPWTLDLGPIGPPDNHVGTSPNPVSLDFPVLRIDLNGVTCDKVMVTNELGSVVRIVLVKSIEDDELDLSGLPSGAYRVSLYNDLGRLASGTILIQ